MSDEATLLPCPFCGGEVEMHYDANGSKWVACENRECAIQPYLYRTKRTEAEAIAAWNTRSDYAVQAENERKAEQAIAATLGRPKAKAHPYGYERDTGAYDCTRCECGCINDISATYCNDCGGEIEIDESAEKEYYDGYSKHTVFAKKHDDGSLEFGERCYVPEDAATLVKPNATSNQESIVRSFLSKISPNRDWDYLGEHEHAMIADLVDDIAATLGSGTCEFVDDSDSEPSPPKCSACGYDPGIYECEWYEDGTYGYERNYCPNCGAKVKGVRWWARTERQGCCASCSKSAASSGKGAVDEGN